MMKFYSIFFLLIMGVAPIQAQAQDTTRYGLTTEEEIRQQYPIFDIYTHRYQPDSLSIEYLKSVTDSIHIVTIMGTWCKDSKKHVPSLFKILHLSKNTFISNDYIQVDYSKNDSTNAYKRFNLTVNPTFIIFKEGLEIGRIEEFPTKRLEQNLVQILIRSGINTN